MADRYVNLITRIRNKYGLTDTDIDDPTMDIIWTTVIETYSQFRGVRGVREITFAPSTVQYALQDAEFYIVEVYWNETYPTQVFVTSYSQSTVEERFHYPSIPILDAWKSRMREKNVSTLQQEWSETEDQSNNRVIELDQQPTTNILVEFRKLYSKKNFPKRDERILALLMEAEVLQRMMGCGQVSKMGDVTYNTKETRDEIKRLRTQFFRAVQSQKIGRS